MPFQHALRTLRSTPGFAFVTILALGLGIGANSAIFSVVNAVLLRPLPYAQPDRLVRVHVTTPQTQATAFSPADFLDLKRESRAFAHLASFREDVLDLGGDTGQPEHLGALRVSAAFFDVLGVPPALGRVFHESTDAQSGEALAVIGHAVWTRRFASDPASVGRAVRLSGETVTIVGVMPEGFAWPSDEIDVYALAPEGVPPAPVEIEGDLAASREVSYFDAIGRLAPDVTLDRAEADVQAVAGDLARRYPATNDGRGFRVNRLHDELVGDVRPALLVLLGAVGCVLLIACANVAGLLLARAAGRQREIAIRAAIGATRGRLVRQLMAESLVFAALGGCAGLLLAGWGTRLLVGIAPDSIPRLSEVTLDARVVAFTLLVSVLTAVLFGIVPAFQISQVDPVEALNRGGGRAAGGGRSRFARRAIVVVELALAVVLLVGASLLLTSFFRLQAVDPGFRPDNVVAISLPLPQARYATPQRQARFYADVVARLSEIPATRSVAAGFPIPMWGAAGSATFYIEGRPKPERRSKPTAALGAVSPGYFRTLGVPLLRGRDVRESDTDAAPKVVIVSASLAALHWPGQDALGGRVQLGPETAPFFTIVGIVGDMRLGALDEAPRPAFYLPYHQFALPFFSLVVRSAAGEDAIVASARAVVRTLDPDLPLGEARALERIVSRNAAQPRFRAALLATFAAVALVLASIGVYGLISQSVAQRVPEIGIRVALGGSPAQMLGLIVREGAALAGVGVALGLAASVALTRLVQSLLFDVSPSDPLTYASVSVLLVGVALVASLLPARRAMRVDPIVALRAE